MLSEIKRQLKSRLKTSKSQDPLISVTAEASSSSQTKDVHQRLDIGEIDMFKNEIKTDQLEIISGTSPQPPPATSNDNPRELNGMSGAIIPPEIMLFHIIDMELCDDVPTLKRLSLTCGLIYAHVQKYIFQAIIIRPTNPNDNEAKTMYNFLRTVSTRNEIRPYIRSLNITVMKAVEAYHPDQNARIETSCLISILQLSFPNLDSFHLALDESLQRDFDSFPWGKVEDAVKRLLRSPKLTQVTLDPPGFLEVAIRNTLM